MESETNSETNSNSNVLQDRQEIAAKIAILAVLGTWESANVWSFPMRSNVEGKYHHLVKSRAQFNELWAKMRNEVATARLISLDFEERRLSDKDMKNMAMVFDKKAIAALESTSSSWEQSSPRTPLTFVRCGTKWETKVLWLQSAWYFQAKSAKCSRIQLCWSSGRESETT
jgi:hypothetical protein